MSGALSSMAELQPKFRFADPVLLIGGGEVSAPALRVARAKASVLIAADGGANHFEGDKSALAAVIGDLDSLGAVAEWRAALSGRLLALAEQDTTDFEKCLYSVDAPLYLAVGFLGGRMDHSLATMHVLAKRADQRVILLSEQEIHFIAPRRWRIRLPVGARVSLYPLQPTLAERSAGLRWGLDGIDLRIGDRVGTSNEVSEPDVEVDLAGDGGDGDGDGWSSLLVTLGSEHLDAAMESIGGGAIDGGRK